MTDKQIIIDGVDVSRCEHLYREIDCLAHIDFSECCEGYKPSYGYCPNTDCYYKQLKRKEQECDMWKNLTVDNGAVALKYQQQLDQLKAENSLLRQTHKTEQDRRRAYENALTEIKDIAEDTKDKFYDAIHTGGLYDRLEQIIRKINEVEDE